MKKMIAIIATLAMAATANASVKGALRGDWSNTETKTGTASTKGTHYAPVHGEVSYGGVVGADTTFDMVADFTTITFNLDTAVLTKKLMDGLNLRFGLIGGESGGMEAYVSALDGYVDSHSYSQWKLGNEFGFALDYQIGDATISLHNFNNKAAGTADANGTFSGLVYNGKYMEGALTPHVSYYAGSGAGALSLAESTYGDMNGDADTADSISAVAGSKYTSMTVGTGYKVSGVQLVFDYHMNSVTKAGLVLADDKASETGFVLAAAMTEGMYHPFFKYTSSALTYDTGTGTTSKMTFTNMGLGVEIMPKADEDFRYHVAYATTEAKPETGDKTTTATLLAGIKFGADFLK